MVFPEKVFVKRSSSYYTKFFVDSLEMSDSGSSFEYFTAFSVPLDKGKFMDYHNQYILIIQNNKNE